MVLKKVLYIEDYCMKSILYMYRNINNVCCLKMYKKRVELLKEISII